VTGWASAIVYGGANFSVGLMIGFKAMFASVIGGFGTVRGAVVGALLLAFIEVAWSSTFSTGYRDVAVFTIMVLALIIRPEGLFGIQSTRESEE
jgi:branched-chain amino acid transport system permease protein